MPLASTPNTEAVADAIVAFMQALTYSDSTSVYSLVKLNQIKDVSDYISDGKACLEVYGADDDSEHKAFGGVIWDTQSWRLLSIVSIDDAEAGERLLYHVRDALVEPLQKRFKLGNAGNIFFSQIKPRSGKFIDLERSNQAVRAHIIEIITQSQWQVSLEA